MGMLCQISLRTKVICPSTRQNLNSDDNPRTGRTRHHQWHDLMVNKNRHSFIEFRVKFGFRCLKHDFPVSFPKPVFQVESCCYASQTPAGRPGRMMGASDHLYTGRVAGEVCSGCCHRSCRPRRTRKTPEFRKPSLEQIQRHHENIIK